MGFDDNFIEQVRNSVSIVRVIDRYLPLKKKGKDYGALCPFHSEKTPSFWVSEEKQIFKCFGCGAGGDVFSFVMQMESLNFPESVRSIAESNGIALPSSTADPKQTEKRSRLLKLLEASTRLFQQALQSREGRSEGMGYLSSRGISAETVAEFGLGYAPPGRALLDEIFRQGYSREELLESGLFKENDQGQIYSYFRHRITFPIRDLSGRTIAYGGRILGEGQPKYLNSPETPLYVKSRQLYGLDLAREEIRRQDCAILVEGYFDCVVPRQHGFANLVASLGTSLTQEQIKLLGRFSRNVVVNYDPDLAGANATLRSIGLLLDEGFLVKVVQLPGGLDPDSFIRQEGAEAYRKRLDEAKPFLDYLLDRFIEEQEDPGGPRGKKEIVTRIIPYLLRLTDKIERAGYVARVAERLRIDERLLQEELRRRPVRASKQEPPGGPISDLTTRSEKILLAGVLDPGMRGTVLRQIDDALFKGLAAERIFLSVLKLSREGVEPTAAKLRSETDEPESLDLLERLSFSDAGLPVTEDSVWGAVNELRKIQLRRRKSDLYQQLNKDTESSFEEQKERLSRFWKLKEEDRRLRPKGVDG